MDRLLGLDPQLLHDALWLALNIFVLFFGLSYFLLNPVRSFLEKRQNKIKGELDFASKEKADALALKADYDERIKNVEKEAAQILDEARKKAIKRENEIIEEAKEESARIIKRANAEIELEKKKALEDVKQEMIAIASMMAGKVVAASMDATIQDSLVEETLSEIGDNTWLS